MGDKQHTAGEAIRIGDHSFNGLYPVYMSGGFFYVYFMQAPGLQNIFMGYSYLKPHFKLTFGLNLNVLITVFFMTIPVYIAAVIIPAWRAAVIDSGEVIR